MAQTHQVSGTATSVFQERNDTCVKYHSTIVVRFNSKRITLDSGYHRSATTKLRMNQASNEYGLGYQVFQKDFEWFVVQFNGKTREFKDGMILKR